MCSFRQPVQCIYCSKKSRVPVPAIDLNNNRWLKRHIRTKHPDNAAKHGLNRKTVD